MITDGINDGFQIYEDLFRINLKVVIIEQMLYNFHKCVATSGSAILKQFMSVQNPFESVYLLFFAERILSFKSLKQYLLS